MKEGDHIRAPKNLRPALRDVLLRVISTDATRFAISCPEHLLKPLSMLLLCSFGF